MKKQRQKESHINLSAFLFYIDGDACPVKEAIYKVVQRFKLHSILVSATPIKVPSYIENVVVKAGFNAADDYIVDVIHAYDLLVTADIALAQRVLKKKAYAMDFRGVEFTSDNIGDFMAQRSLMGMLRDTQFEPEKKIKPFTAKHMSTFANNLNNLIQKILRVIEKTNRQKGLL